MIIRRPNKDITYNKLRLHSSEKNSDWSDKLFQEYIQQIDQSDLKFYPNLEELYEKLSIHYNTDHIIVGNGSDRCIEYFFQVNAYDKEILIPNPCFPMYNIYGELYKGKVKKINYNGIKFPINDFLNNINENSICVISNPSSPIGDIISRENIKKILKFEVPVLVDEAYIEFSNENTVIELINEYDNLYVTRTFSKAYGSAGIRLGIIASQLKNIEKMAQFRPMYEVNNLTAKWAIILMNHMTEVNEYIKNVKIVRKEIINICKNMGYEYVDGNSNWIHVKGLINLPENVIFKENCEIPNMGNNWIRLQITDKIKDYEWIK